jgi:PST family polysaccharide transporter
MTIATEESAGLGHKVRRGLAFSLLNSALVRAGTLLFGIVLARLLTPEDFGVFAVALVALNALLSVNELGVSLALVRWLGDPHRIAPTVTTISIGFSVLLYAGCFVAAEPFAVAMNAPEAAGVVRLLCLSVLIDGLTAVPAQLLARYFKQGRRLAVDLANLTITMGTAVALAASGAGAWSLAWGRLVGTAVSALMLFRLASTWPRPGFDRGQAGELLRFGMPLAGASMLVFAMVNVDYLVVGRVLGTAALGFYLLAFQLASWPVNMFSAAARRVSLAAFSRLQDRPRELAAALGRSTALLAAVTLPVCALLGLLALPLVTTVYGPNWAPAAAALQYLALLGLARVLIELFYDFLVAAGRTRQTMALQGLWTALLVPALTAGALVGGIAGVALAHALVALLVVIPAYAVSVLRVGVPVRVLLRPLALPALGTVLLTGAVLVVRAAIDPGLVQLAVGCLVGFAVYLPVVAPLRKLARGSAGPAETLDP